MAGFNLADILSQISNFQDVLRESQGRTETTVEDTQRLRTEQIDAAGKVLSNTLDQTAIENQQKLQMEQRKKKTAEAFGTDILDPQNRIAFLAREQQIAQDEALYNSKRAAELRDTNLYDSPLDYMLARPFATRNDQAAADANQRAAMLNSNLNDINAATQATVKTQSMIQETFTADQAALALEAAKLSAEDKIRTLRMNQNSAYLNDLKTLREVPAEQIRQATNGYTLLRHEQEFQARMAALAEERAARAAAKKEEKLGLTEAMAYYNLAADNFGKAKIADIAQFTAMAKGPMKDVIGEMVSRGMGMGIDLSNPEPQQAVSFVARTPGEAIMTLRAVQGSLPKSAERVSALLDITQGEAQRKVLEANPGKKITGDQLITQINTSLQDTAVPDAKGKTKVVKGIISGMRDDVEQDAFGGKVRNIYGAPSVSTMLTAKPDLAQQKWFETIIKPAALTSPAEQPTADQVVKQARLAIAQKAISIDEAAAGLATYYKTAVTVNKINEQYQRVGLPMPTGYNVRIDAGYTLMGGKALKPVDMINEAQVKHALMTAPGGMSLSPLQLATPMQTGAKLLYQNLAK